MCGRYTLTDPDPRLLRFRFGLTEAAEIDQPPRYNVAPTDPVLAVRLNEHGEREPGSLALGADPALRGPGDVRPAADQRAGRDGGRGAGVPGRVSATTAA